MLKFLSLLHRIAHSGHLFSTHWTFSPYDYVPLKTCRKHDYYVYSLLKMLPLSQRKVLENGAKVLERSWKSSGIFFSQIAGNHVFSLLAWTSCWSNSWVAGNLWWSDADVMWHSRLPEPWNQGIIAHPIEHFQWPPKHVNNKGLSIFAQTCTKRYISDKNF